MFTKLTLGLVFGTVTASALAQASTNIQAGTASSAYVQDGRGVITRNAFGLCWRSGYWTPADSIAGCDGELMPPVAKPTAPALMIATPATQTPPAAPAPARCDFAVTLANDQTFAFGKAVLTTAAKNRIDSEVLSKLATCGKVDLILVTGHADRLGAQQYNQKLSDQRAGTVAAYIKSKGVATRIDTLGVGKTQSIKQCGDQLDHKILIECLAPNRRVVVEVRGLAK